MAYLFEIPKLTQVLNDYAREAVELYKYQLGLGRKNATHTLMDTVTAKVSIGNTAFEVTLSLQDYWKYVEGGQKGSKYPNATSASHFPPPDAILEWIHAKPIVPTPDDNGKIPSLHSLAYLIGRKIATEGIEPFPALATTVEQLDEKYHDKIAEALADDVGSYLMVMFK